MCELLGASCATPSPIGPWFEAFRHRAATNVHGWGAAWYGTSGQVELVKEPQRADESAVAAALARRSPSTRSLVAHVRAASVGGTSTQNTHPFTAPALGRTWVFAHNGTIAGHEELDVGGRTAHGDTDSERAFLHLLAAFEQLGPSAATGDEDGVVLAVARELTRRGKANFLLSDGTTVYARYDGWKQLHRRVGDGEVVISSVPLSDDGWEPLAPGALLVLRGGAVAAEERTVETAGR